VSPDRSEPRSTSRPIAVAPLTTAVPALKYARLTSTPRGLHAGTYQAVGAMSGAVGEIRAVGAMGFGGGSRCCATSGMAVNVRCTTGKSRAFTVRACVASL
jgi:hypothetical protein